MNSYNDDQYEDEPDPFGDFESHSDEYENSLNDMQVQQGRFSCSFCGSPNDTFIDPSQGPDQEYIEDCQTCCAPNQLRLSWQESTSSWEMHSSEY